MTNFKNNKEELRASILSIASYVKKERSRLTLESYAEELDFSRQSLIYQKCYGYIECLSDNYLLDINHYDVKKAINDFHELFEI